MKVCGLPMPAAAMLAIAILQTAGCTAFSLSPTPDKTRYFVLTATAHKSMLAPDSSPLAIGLGPVQLPAYIVNRDELATRSTPNRIEYSTTDRWAAPIDENFQQVFARDLSAMLGTDQVVLFPWDLSTHLDYRVSATIEHFERDTDDSEVLSGHWQIRAGNSDRVLQSGNVHFSAPAGTDPASGLSRDLGDLSRQIADAIARLQATQPSPPAESASPAESVSPAPQ
jgi:uncharacterized lipoprotein YmbA